MSRTWMVLALGLLPALARAQPAAPGGDAALPKGTAEAIRSGDWTKVAEILGPLAEKGKPAEPVQYWYGVALYHLKKRRPAVHHLEAALKANPRSPATARYLARAARRTQDMDAVEAAVKAFPNDPVVLAEAGRRHFFLFDDVEFSGDAVRMRTTGIGHLSQATGYLRRAVALDPTSSDARYWLARALEAQGQTHEAIEHLLVVERLGPMGYDSYGLLGLLYTRVGEQSRAAAAFQAAAEAAPAKSPKANWYRAMALWRADRNAEAVEVFREVFRRDHKHQRVRYYLGRAAYDAGDYALALFAFRESWQADGKLDALGYAACCAYEMGQDKAAVELIDKAVEAGKKRTPQGETFHVESMWHFVRGRALWRLGEKKKAAIDLEEAARKRPSNEEYATWAVYALRELGDPISIAHVAKRYGANGHPDEALALLAELPKLYPAPTFRDHRGGHHPGGLGQVAAWAAGSIYESINNYRAAWQAIRAAGYHSEGRLNSWACWLALRAGQHNEAARMFEALARRGDSERSRHAAHQGLAYFGLLMRDAAAVRRHVKAFGNGEFKETAPTALKWAAVFAGDEGAADKLDTFDLLGIYGLWFSGGGKLRGVAIDALIPGSPLWEAFPEVQPKDVVIAVAGGQIRDVDGVNALRRAPVPKGPTPVVIRRGRQVFEVRVDFEAVRAAARKLAAGKPEGGTP